LKSWILDSGTTREALDARGEQVAPCGELEMSFVKVAKLGELRVGRQTPGAGYQHLVTGERELPREWGKHRGMDSLISVLRG